MKLRPVSLGILLLAASLAQAAQAQERRSYIVQLVDKPAATYTGQVNGLAATRPAPTATPLIAETVGLEQLMML